MEAKLRHHTFFLNELVVSTHLKHINAVDGRNPTPGMDGINPVNNGNKLPTVSTGERRIF